MTKWYLSGHTTFADMLVALLFLPPFFMIVQIKGLRIVVLFDLARLPNKPDSFRF